MQAYETVHTAADWGIIFYTARISYGDGQVMRVVPYSEYACFTLKG